MNKDLKSVDTTQHAVNAGKLVNNLATSLVQSGKYTNDSSKSTEGRLRKDEG